MPTGNDLFCRLKEAIPKWMKHAQHFTMFSASLNPAVQAQWAEMVRVWDMDHTMENPYEVNVTFHTQANVWCELAVEEAVDACVGMETVDDMSVGEFLTRGLDLEEAQ